MQKIIGHCKQRHRAHTHTWPRMSALRCTAHKVQGTTQWHVLGLYVRGIGQFWVTRVGTSQTIGRKCLATTDTVTTSTSMHDSVHGESSERRTKMGSWHPWGSIQLQSEGYRQEWQEVGRSQSWDCINWLSAVGTPMSRSRFMAPPRRVMMNRAQSLAGEFGSHHLAQKNGVLQPAAPARWPYILAGTA